MSLRIMLNENHFNRLVNGETITVAADEFAKIEVELAIEDIGFERMAEIIETAITRRAEIRRTAEGLDRERVVELLESVSIACYDHETDTELRNALVENVLDGTIEEDLLDE